MSHPPRTPIDAAEDAPRRGGEREQDEARLRQAEKLEALGALAGGVAHDLDELLAAILGHADVLASELCAEDPRRRDAEQIAAAARRAKGVVQRILALAPCGPAEPQALDVARAVREELALVRTATRAGGATAAATAPRARGSGRILLVDDDPPVARALGRILERLGYEVTACGDGAEALARFRAEPTRFDAVLTDETLPGMRGHQLTRELLALRPELPVLICTGYSEHLDEERAREIGARGLFMKPFDVAQLAEALRAALAR